MVHGWRHRVAAGCLRLTVLAGTVLVSTVAVAAAMASDVAATQPTVTPTNGGAATGLSAAQKLVGERAAALANATAQTTTLSVALAVLQVRAEVLTERYDQEASLEQQAAAAYQATAVRLAAARTTARRASTLLAQQAAADYEADGGPSAAAAMFAGAMDPQGYLGALGIQQTMDGQRSDLLAASQADEIVTRLFAKQAAVLLARQRADAQSAGFLRLAVQAAVNRQVRAVRAAKTSRAMLAAVLAGARAGEASLSRTGVAAPGLAGGPNGAAPGVVAPDWSADAGASAAQGNIAATWALTQLGKPYQWGGAGPASYDCSGLAMDAWARAGVPLLHWTGYQWPSGPHVPLSQLRRGDLVFYATDAADAATIHHVGIYIGGGLMVDAPHTGAFVRIDSMYAYAGLIGATRPAA
jgi:cell wall-associated NlpC family hydrolase